MKIPGRRLRVCKTPSLLPLISTARPFKKHCIVISVTGQQTKFSDMEQVVNRPTDLQEDFNWVRTYLRSRGGS